MPINRMKGIHTPSRSLLLLSIQVMERPANGFNCLWRVDSAFSTSHVWFCLSAHLRVCSSGRLFPYLSAYLPVCLSTGLPVYVSTYIQLHIDLHIFKYMFYFAVCLSDCLITNLYTFNKEMELSSHSLAIKFVPVLICVFQEHTNYVTLLPLINFVPGIV